MATRITVLRNGPLRVESDELQLVDADGNAYGLGGRNSVTLCRCGASMNKPYCDGMHRTVEFRDRGAAFDLAPTATT
jgi:CDGSH-type Zn-finger protein